jgi:hypothetical protein
MTGNPINQVGPKLRVLPTAVVSLKCEHSPVYHVITGRALQQPAGTYNLQTIALFDGRTEGDAPRTRSHGLWCGDMSDTSLLHGPLKPSGDYMYR